MGLKEVNSADVATMSQDSGLMVVDCYAPWCGPCRVLKPKLEALSEDTPDVRFVAINIDENQDFVKQHGIRSIPTLLFYRAGEVVHTMVGAPNERRIKEEIDRQLKEPSL